MSVDVWSFELRLLRSVRDCWNFRIVLFNWYLPHCRRINLFGNKFTVSWCTNELGEVLQVESEYRWAVWKYFSRSNLGCSRIGESLANRIRKHARTSPTTSADNFMTQRTSRIINSEVPAKFYLCVLVGNFLPFIWNYFVRGVNLYTNSTRGSWQKEKNKINANDISFSGKNFVHRFLSEVSSFRICNETNL